MEDTYAGETGRRDSDTFSTTFVSAVLQQPVPQQATHDMDVVNRMQRS